LPHFLGFLGQVKWRAITLMTSIKEAFENIIDVSVAGKQKSLNIGWFLESYILRWLAFLGFLRQVKWRAMGLMTSIKEVSKNIIDVSVTGKQMLIIGWFLEITYSDG